MMESSKIEYANILALQEFDESDLDYSILEQHKIFLTQLAQVSNSGITIFDMYRQEHVFTSYNFSSLFGYNLEAIKKEGNNYFNERVHPDDMQVLEVNAIKYLRLLHENKNNLKDFKLINEYRIRDINQNYVRIIEQHKVLEFDKKGNIWLSLSVLDISPDQHPFQGVKSQLMNCNTGEYRSVHELFPESQSNLSPREIEVLQMIKDGLMSKEISARLFISVHTVNTHRQKILEKLNVDNSMEAVKYASSQGLLL